MNKKIITLVIAGAVAFAVGCDKENETTSTSSSHNFSSSRSCQLRTDMRKLWEDHITYTRNVIFGLVDDLPGTDEALSRLLTNQNDIGNAIRPYYGDAAADQLTTLLREHIAQAADVVLAAKANDPRALEIANNKWYANADSIAVLLSGANPHWPLEEMKTMMHDHLALTTNEAVARINGNYQADVEAFDAVHAEILLMADMLSDGIMKQFPTRF